MTTPGIELVSPNNVTANAMLRTVDMIRPRLQATRPERVALVVGTQINGAPHLGTSLVQTAAFLLAKAIRRTFNVDAVVRFGALCGRDEALTKVKRVSRYESFEQMLDAEGPAKVNPDSPRHQQLANIRRIYDPEKEALGVLAIEIELIPQS